MGLIDKNLLLEIIKMKQIIYGITIEEIIDEIENADEEYDGCTSCEN